MDNMYTEGICADGADILKDGGMMTISEILAELNQSAEKDRVIERISQALADNDTNYVVAAISRIVEESQAKAAQATPTPLQKIGD